MKKILANFLFLPFAVFAADTNALPALTPAYGELQPTFLEQHKAFAIIGVFAFLILTGLVFWKLLQPKSVVISPPEIVAREALEKLKRQPEDGKILSEISQTLRRYLSTAFEFSTDEMTTAEFSAALFANQKIGAEFAQTISNFLRECDDQKFSRSNSASLNAANRALEIVELAEKRRTELRAQISTAK